jgi:hypothetical protein
MDTLSYRGRGGNLVLRSETVELYRHSSICVHGDKLIEPRSNLSFIIIIIIIIIIPLALQPLWALAAIF